MKSTRKTDSSRHFRLIRALQGKRAHVAPNQPISFGGDHRSSAKSITHGFIRQYAPLPSSCKRIRLILRQMEKSHPIDGSFSPFTFEDTVEAIKMSKNSTAVGPDGLAPWHLKNIGRKAISYLTSIFNLSVATAEMPSIWKMARIIPVLKPGKSADKGISYRPISLLCPAVKNFGTSNSSLSHRRLQPRPSSTWLPSQLLYDFRSPPSCQPRRHRHPSTQATGLDRDRRLGYI